MFERWSYLGYTLMFCLPPLVLLWLRREFASRMARDLWRILAASLLLTAYGCVIWPVALKMRAWSYAEDRILGIKLFGYVHLEDAVWWLLVSFLLASFISLSIRYEDEGVNIFLREVRGLLRSFGCALHGLRMLRLERNLTIHAAAAVFVFLEAAFLKVSALECLVLLLVAAVVLGLELVNSTIERLGNPPRQRCGGGSSPLRLGCCGRRGSHNLPATHPAGASLALDAVGDATVASPISGASGDATSGGREYVRYRDVRSRACSIHRNPR
jgi:lycopene cyclase domain-containing protein